MALFRKLLALPTLVALGLAGLVLTGTPAAHAAPAFLCNVLQLTETTGGVTGTTSIGGSEPKEKILFVSTHDLTGQNPDGNQEVFLREVDTGIVIQLTTTASGSSVFPMIDDAFSKLVFASSANLTGGNADGNTEIFVLDIGSLGITQITNTTGTGNNLFDFSGNGDRILFRSQHDFEGTNADGNYELFFYDLSASDFVQVTNTTTNPNNTGRITRDGARIVWHSTNDLNGTNPDGNQEIWLWQDGVGIANVTLTTGGFNSEPAITDEGNLVAFVSDRDLTGGNADLNGEVFLDDLSGPLTQITNTTGGGYTAFPDIDADGSRIVFLSDRDIVGSNADLNREYFVWDHVGSTVQLTDTTGGIFNPAPRITDDGTRIAFEWDRDPTGHNPDGNFEAFFGACGTREQTFSDMPTNLPFFSAVQWMQAATVASGFPDGTFHPQDGVKRQQMANFLYNLAGRPAFSPPFSSTYSDVTPSNPFWVQIEWMAAEGIASGFPDGTFRPQAPVKRQQMANFLHNLAGQPPFTPPGSPTFSDVGPSNPFFMQIEWMWAEAIAGGFPDFTFRPREPVKRQQMASFLYYLTAGPGVHL